jgi:uncharacterized damage-inducible protein DinB
MSIADFLSEFEREAATTRRVLERVPSDKLTWAPHAKSMTIGKLSMHLAGGPKHISHWFLEDVYSFTPNPTPEPASTEEILAAHDASVAAVREHLPKISDESLTAPWSAKMGEQTLLAMPRGVAMRTLLMSHFYHHRGQLSVYLRLLDVKVPSIYGPSADENPFG